jgi:hypothetical protein
MGIDGKETEYTPSFGGFVSDGFGRSWLRAFSSSLSVSSYINLLAPSLAMATALFDKRL